ncbi:Transposase [Palleronia marisminoris]|uniref:Transposase n=1 Tax=Palleronia marisminoris TaxID=315423 RepID=A0A1Y5REH1_9RHOB|nr:Transposase [Palleronia marisminoris]SLN14719.1 hypothetical protein PAM7066_00279 [Palleronia marisminoris]
MPRKRHKPEEIVAKLRQVDVLVPQGQAVAEPVRSIGVTQFTCYRWLKEFVGLKIDQVKRLKALEKENERLRKASITSGRNSGCRNGSPAVFSDSIAPHSGRCREGGRTRTR